MKKWRNKLVWLVIMILFVVAKDGSFYGLSFFSEKADAETNRYHMSYIYFGMPNTYLGQVDKTKNSLQMVSPNYFDITEEGDLDITWKLDPAFIDEMHRRGIRVVPFLSNHWSKEAGINAMALRDELAGKIVDAVQEYDLDGVNVDIEGITDTYRSEFTDFIRLIREKLPEGALCVCSCQSEWLDGWLAWIV